MAKQDTSTAAAAAHSKGGQHPAFFCTIEGQIAYGETIRTS
jgi:hypothetical protein